MTRPLRIAFFTEGVDIPASRFRCEQFLPHFEREGIEYAVFHGYGPRYNAMHRHPLGPLYKLACRSRRAMSTVTAKGFDLFFLQRTAFPFSALPEQLRQALGKPTVFDFDDLLDVGPRGRTSASRARTFRASIRGATHVIAGNGHLAALADAPRKTTIIPTVVDTTIYRPPEIRPLSEPLTIGWMGTSSNFKSLRTALPGVTQVLNARPHIRFRVVSNAPFSELNSHKQVEQVPWSRARELELLQSFDIGLMPLEDTPVTRGKCGFKMLQYMATGSAVVSSAVGANPELFKDSHSGALVPVGGDWTKPLLELVDDSERRRAAAQSGRRHVDSRYSVRTMVPLYINLFKRVCSPKPDLASESA
jgi:glycosyltransferase involved in cell wall biosynthesis